MSFSPKVPNYAATPAPVIEKKDPALFETPGDKKSARKLSQAGRAALRIDRADPMASTGLNIPSL